MADRPQRPDRARLDQLVVERGLASSRERAQALILAGRICVDDHTVDKPATRVRTTAEIRRRGTDPCPYVSRGGLKLAAGLAAFPAFEVRGARVLDVGASTGGFTDCLLRHGAARVYAVDVGHNQLAWALARDPRVVSLERTDVRALDVARIEGPVTRAVADCSFVSLSKLLPAIAGLLAPQALLLALVKPQFEVGPAAIAKGGVVKDPSARARALAEVQARAAALGFRALEAIPSPVPGRTGNVEWLALWRYAPAPRTAPDD